MLGELNFSIQTKLFIYTFVPTIETHMSKTRKHTNRRLRSSYFTTIVSMSMVLFMLGLLGLLILNSKKINDHVKGNIGFSIIMQNEVPLVRVMELKKALDAAPYVKYTEYISPEQAAEDLQKDLGENFIDFLGFNPLLPSIDLRLNANYANMDSLKVIEQQVLENKDVKEVYYQASLVEMINHNAKRIGFFILLFSGLLLIVSVTLIHNTIRLAVHSKRFLIRSMQLVGATRAFIRAPFVRIGMLHGLIAALFASLGLGVLIYFLIQEIPELLSLQDFKLFLLLFAGILIISMIITWWSNRKAVNTYLKAHTDDLYIH